MLGHGGSSATFLWEHLFNIVISLYRPSFMSSPTAHGHMCMILIATFLPVAISIPLYTLAVAPEAIFVSFLYFA